MADSTVATEGRPNVRDYYLREYERTTPAQQRWTEATATPELVKLVRSGLIPAGASVLDIGCGVGTEAVYLASQGFRVSGLDISPHAIERARELAKVYDQEVDWRVGDVLDLPFAPETFDVVVDRGCFHCFTAVERPAFAEQVAKVIRPDGLYTLRCLSRQQLGSIQAQPANEFVRQFGVTALELWDTLSPHFACEHLELGSADDTSVADRVFGWYTRWRRTA